MGRTSSPKERNTGECNVYGIYILGVQSSHQHRGCGRNNGTRSSIEPPDYVYCDLASFRLSIPLGRGMTTHLFLFFRRRVLNPPLAF